jgi:hypothetical protein
VKEERFNKPLPQPAQFRTARGGAQHDAGPGPNVARRSSGAPRGFDQGTPGVPGQSLPLVALAFESLDFDSEGLELESEEPESADFDSPAESSDEEPLALAFCFLP